MDSLGAGMTLTTAVRSPSGRFALTYRSDGSAAILDEESGEVRWVAGGAFAEIGIDEPEELDDDQYDRIDQLELLCRIARIRPTLEAASGPARVAIFPVDWTRLRPAATG